jgi:hypothetical protein
MAEIRSWSVRDLQFFIMSSTGKKCSAGYLNRVWNDFAAGERVDAAVAGHGVETVEGGQHWPVRSRSVMRRSISAFTAPPESPVSVGGTSQIVAAPVRTRIPTAAAPAREKSSEIEIARRQKYGQ